MTSPSSAGSTHSPTRYWGECPNDHTIKTVVWERGTREGKWIRCGRCEQIGFARMGKDVQEWYEGGGGGSNADAASYRLSSEVYDS